MIIEILNDYNNLKQKSIFSTPMKILLMQMAKKGSALHSSLPLDGIHYEAIITSVIFWYSVMKSLIKLVDFAKDSMVRKITILFYEHAN